MSVTVELSREEAQALAYALAYARLCDGDECGKASCAVLSYHLHCVRFKLARAIVGMGIPPDTVEIMGDARAVATAWLDQRRAELVERGLL